MDTEKLIKKIIKCAYNVRGQLPQGFLESVYKNALLLEMQKNDLKIETEVPVKIYYDDTVVGEYRADILVDNSVIIELKAVNRLTIAHEVQLVNYLSAFKIDNGILINFGGENIEIKRKYRLYNRT